MVLFDYVMFERPIINIQVGLLVEGCNLELRRRGGLKTALGCFSIKVIFKAIHWMVEITGHEC